MRTSLAIVASLALLSGLSAAADEPIRVGVYVRAMGAKSVHKALAKQKGLKSTTFKDLTPDAVFAYDAVYIGACTLDRPQQVKALRTFVACGGGLVFNHNSCGRRQPQTLFPAIVAKVVDRREDTIVVVGHEPRLSLLIATATGKRIRPLEHLEVACLDVGDAQSMRLGLAELAWRYPVRAHDA